MNKNVGDLNNTVNQHNIIDFARKVHPKNAVLYILYNYLQNILYKCIQTIHLEKPCAVHIASLNKYRRTEITEYVL